MGPCQSPIVGIGNSVRIPFRFKGLASKIYFAFLVAAGVPVAVAGLVGIYLSLETLRQETLFHLEQEVHGRAEAMGLF